MRLSRAQLMDLAMQRVDILLDNALLNAKEDMALAQRQAAMARSICLKYNVRLPYQKRQLFCRGCKRLILPGLNSRVRVGGRGRRAVRSTCLDCGHTYRKILATKVQGRAREGGA